jgi:beta-galactosidase
MRDERSSDREMRDERHQPAGWGGLATAHLAAVAVTALALGGSANAGYAQTQSVQQALSGRVVPDSSTLLAFADTAGVRIELSVARGAALDGQMLTAAVVPVEGGKALWVGKLGPVRVDSTGVARVVSQLRGLKAERWSPEHPRLYRLAVFLAPRRELSVRFGFRSLTARAGQLYLNGRQIFLSGNAINPPERNIPDSLSENPAFARDYLRYLKSVGVNIIRLDRPSKVWFDAADETGMMIFQGHYGTPKGGTSTSPPDDISKAIDWYVNDVIAPQANHPSVVIYTLSNEQAAPEIPYLTKGAAAIDRFLTIVHDSLSRWDDTRLYIANAGYGFGRASEICDIHRYWGWYYNSFLSFYTLRDPHVCWRTDTPQPITLTENTGNYTGPDGRFNLVSDTKQPESQLNWTGHAPDAEQSRRALAYQALVAKQAIEITRRLRERNPYLAGLMPFTIIFRNWAGIGSFADMSPKPIADQYAISYSPVLLSWELWTSQVYAGTTINPVAHVVNDDTSGRALTKLALRWELADSGGAVVAHGSRALADVPYFAAQSDRLTMSVPASLPTGSYTLRGTLSSGARTLSRNEQPLWVARRDFAGAVGAPRRRIVLVDPAGATDRAFFRLKIAHATATHAGATLLNPARDAVIVASGAATAADAPALRAFAEQGGRVVILAPDSAGTDLSWLPVPLGARSAPLDHGLVYPGGRPFRQGMAINPERQDHPVLDGIDRDRLFLWSDPTGWSESRPGFPTIYPVTAGVAPVGAADLTKLDIIADYDHGLEGIALAEEPLGRGRVLVSAFGLVPRVGLDPVADRLLTNLVRYATADSLAPLHPLIDSRIRWGDYASERGVVPEGYSGLLLNTEPRVPTALAAEYPVKVNAEGFHIAGGPGGWNSKPSIQYVARGRRPFGPYGYTLGGSVQPAKGTPEGRGEVAFRVPPGRTALRTSVENPADSALTLTVTVNGADAQATIPAQGSAIIENVVAPGTTSITLEFRGDRRLILVETDFR